MAAPIKRTATAKARSDFIVLPLSAVEQRPEHRAPLVRQREARRGTVALDQAAHHHVLRRGVCDAGRLPVGHVPAIAATVFRFLRQPSRPITPRPVAKSGRAAGRGVAGGAERLGVCVVGR